MFKRQQYETNDSDRFPLWAMWLQIRAALAELLVPVFAGWKTLWLVLVTPKSFFEAYCFHTRPMESLKSPLDPLWRGVSAEERSPLEPAQFLLFGIFMAALAGFKFDNSNQLTGLFARVDEVYGVWNSLAQRADALGNLARGVREWLASPTMQVLQTFSDQEFLAAVWELFATLLVLVLFAYIFRLLVGWRAISAANSYTFWLYMAGGQFVTTGISTLFFSLVSLSALGLPPIAPDLFFWIIEMGLALLWQVLLPAWVLPRLFPALSFKGVVIAAVVGRGLLKLLGWLIGGGVLLTILITS